MKLPLTVVILIMLLLGVMAAEVKFTADQCRFLKMTHVDTRGICNKPVPKPAVKRSRVKR